MRGLKYLGPAVLKTLIAPPLLAYLLLHAGHVTLLPSQIITYIASFPTLFILRSYISLCKYDQAAKYLGAGTIPRVKGRWPLNLDILVGWSKSGTGDEAERMMALLGREHGHTYNTRVLGEDQIFTTDPRVMKHVLLDEFDNFPKSDKIKERFMDFLGDGIFNSDGERWKFHRTQTRPFFHPDHVNLKVFAPLITTFLDDLPKEGEAVDMQARLSILSARTAMMWMCGEVVNQEEIEELSRAMAIAQKIVSDRVKIGTPWPLLEIGKEPLKEPMVVIRTFWRKRIALAVKRQHQVEDGDKVFMIDRLLQVTDDHQLIEDQRINIFLAAKDTTASAMTFSVYIMTLMPEEAQKIVKESSRIDSDTGIDKSKIRDCKYTRFFINEVLRLFPPVPINIRRTLRTSLLPTSNGELLHMPANTSVILNFMGMQRSTAWWGEDAQDFKPERWNTIGKERESFMSWNYGPRMCLGQPLALTVLHTFLIMFSQHLLSLPGPSSTTRLSLVPKAWNEADRIPDDWLTEKGDGRARNGKDRVWVVADVVLAIKGGLWIKMGV